jgi:hypothetical protein
VALDGAGGDAQVAGDLLAGKAAGCQAEDSDLPGGELCGGVLA